MDTAVKHLLAELEEFGKANDAIHADKTQQMLNLEPQTAVLVHLLLKLGRFKRVLEIGTSNGHSTIWIADALCECEIEGHLTTIDINPVKTEKAKVNVRRAGFTDRVTFIEGDASQIVGNLHGSFDCIFFDADRISSKTQLVRLLPKLNRAVERGGVRRGGSMQATAQAVPELAAGSGRS
jgi:predicted O-methyltransferase YrrM